MRSTKANYSTLPAATNQATVPTLNHVPFAFDVFRSRYHQQQCRERHLQTVATVLKRLQGDSKWAANGAVWKQMNGSRCKWCWCKELHLWSSAVGIRSRCWIFTTVRLSDTVKKKMYHSYRRAHIKRCPFNKPRATLLVKLWFRAPGNPNQQTPLPVILLLCLQLIKLGKLL